INHTFAECKRLGKPALITFMTAGFPSPDETPAILLGMQAGGADIIELGLPVSTPTADGPTIQEASKQAIDNGVTAQSTMQMLRDARSMGLHIPVILMGYYASVVEYGDARMVADCRDAGFDGFLIVDMPCQKAVGFRQLCLESGLSYIPIIPPSANDSAVADLCAMTDSFIYLISRVGVTGQKTQFDREFFQRVSRVKYLAGSLPVAVGFGIRTRGQVRAVGAVADGAVIGSRIVSELAASPLGSRAQAVKRFCEMVKG
ncbi:hypothetical protein BO70DRAFT_259865, partial [Aspergillus heteromorphus CBS 117.55]